MRGRNVPADGKRELLAGRPVPDDAPAALAPSCTPSAHERTRTRRGRFVRLARAGSVGSGGRGARSGDRRARARWLILPLPRSVSRRNSSRPACAARSRPSRAAWPARGRGGPRNVCATKAPPPPAPKPGRPTSRAASTRKASDCCTSATAFPRATGPGPGCARGRARGRQAAHDETRLRRAGPDRMFGGFERLRRGPAAPAQPRPTCTSATGRSTARTTTHPESGISIEARWADGRSAPLARAGTAT